MSKLSLAFTAALALTAFAGCKKKPAADVADCAGAMEHAATVAKADPQNATMDEATTQKMKLASIARCTEDKWAPDVIGCFNAAKDTKGLEACFKKLTPDQSSKFQSAMMDAAKPPAGSAAPAGSGSGSAVAGSGSDAGSAAPAGSGSGSAAAGSGSDAGSGSAMAGSGSAMAGSGSAH